MTEEQKNNADIIINTLKQYGINNDFTISAILAVAMKESQLIPKSENLNYTAKRITQVWPRIPFETAKTLERNPVALGNYVYCCKFGNTRETGYLYRGRAFNQLTWHDNYKIYGDLIGENLVKYPDRANDVNVASKVLYWYMKRNADGWNINLNNLTVDNAYNVIYAFNAGKNPNTSGSTLQANDTTGGYLTGKKHYSFFLGYNPELKKKINIGLILAIGLIALIIYNRK